MSNETRDVCRARTCQRFSSWPTVCVAQKRKRIVVHNHLLRWRRMKRGHYYGRWKCFPRRPCVLLKTNIKVHLNKQTRGRENYLLNCVRRLAPYTAQVSERGYVRFLRIMYISENRSFWTIIEPVKDGGGAESGRVRWTRSETKRISQSKS